MRFVGVAWTGSDAEFQEFIDRHGLTFPQLSDDEAAVYGRFEIPAQPALVVVDADGAVDTLFGAVDEAVLADVLGQAVAG